MVKLGVAHSRSSMSTSARARQCPMADCGAVSTAAPLGHADGGRSQGCDGSPHMIQINAVARLRHQEWRMAFDPKRASIIEAAEIATGICVALVGT
jgi:hypothetical protein